MNSTEKTTLLLIEDNKGDARLLVEILKEIQNFNYSLDWQENLSAGIRFLKSNRVDLILLDLKLPDSEGLETVTKVLSEGLSVPIIVMTGQHDDVLATKAVGIGAQDYLIKGDVDARTLHRSILYAIGRHKIAQELEKKNAELATALDTIRKQADLLDNILKTLPVGVILSDKSGNIVQMNEQARKIWAGSTHVSMDHYSLYKGWWPSTGERVKDEEWPGSRSLMYGETAMNVEVEIENFANERKTILISSVPVRDTQQKISGSLVVMQDVTEKKNLEAQFLRSQRLESIGTLAGGIAHDLNNILTPVTISLDLIKGYLKDEEHQKIFTLLATNIKRAADLAKRILTFARGVEGERQAINIDRLIIEIEKTIRETFPRSIEIQTVVPVDLGSITGDYTQLFQVLMNLCVNARDAMSSGGLLRISASNFSIDEYYTRTNIEAKPGPYVVITVTDSGIGMAPAIINRLFEPFFTTKKQGEGTGLGLSTSLGIVKSHNGFIQVSSEVGHGTTFKVFLPSITPTEEKVNPHQQEGNLKGRGELILVVDDEEMIRLMTMTALNSNGYTTLAANDGAEAVALYAQKKDLIKAVILDMMMPVMDGYSCIQSLQKINPRVKVIGVSGLDYQGKYPEIANIKTHFLLKPYMIDKMLKMIRDLLLSE